MHPDIHTALLELETQLSTLKRASDQISNAGVSAASVVAASDNIRKQYETSLSRLENVHQAGATETIRSVTTSVDELTQSHRKHVDAVQNLLKQAESLVSLVQSLAQVIEGVDFPEKLAAISRDVTSQAQTITEAARGLETSMSKKYDDGTAKILQLVGRGQDDLHEKLLSGVGDLQSAIRSMRDQLHDQNATMNTELRSELLTTRNLIVEELRGVRNDVMETATATQRHMSSRTLSVIVILGILEVAVIGFSIMQWIR
jgi:hypothetical protein